MSKRLDALHSSVAHLATVVARIPESDYEVSAYPTEWSIADTMSHIGSGAVILKHMFDDTVTGRSADGNFNQSVWDEWNAKAPADQVKDALVADAQLLASLESLPDEQRGAFHFSMGPFDLDFDGFVGMRLGEQAMHTWDVEVALDPSAVLSGEVADAVLDGIAMVVGFSGKPTGEDKAVHVLTTNPSRDFTLNFTADSVRLTEGSSTGKVDFEVPAESFVRLVYGRLDKENAPQGIDEAYLETLQSVFPGF
jgi:uncharacterized protein (TIGR03083 family)